MSDKPHGHDNPLQQLWVAMSGASAGHHEETPGVEQKSVAVGHEPDRFGIGGIVAVPVAVIVTLVVTYAIVTGMVNYVNGKASDPIASGDPSINDRLGRINSSGGVAAPGVPGQPLGEPRLDGLPKLDTRVNGKDVAPYLMSFRRTPSGNWPDIYPEDLRPENYTDYLTQKKPLVDSPEAHAGNKGYARIPVADAIEALLKNDVLKKQYVPTADHPLDPAKAANRPKPSNGGQAVSAKPKDH
jgi:hypothetical protein